MVKRSQRLQHQRQRNRLTIVCRKVGGVNQLQRFQAFSPVDNRLGFAAQHIDNIPIIQRMPETVHRRGFIIGSFDLFVVIALVGKIPFLNFVHCHTADAYRAGFAQNGNRAFEVFRLGAHGHCHRTERAVAPTEVHHARVFGFNFAVGRNHRLHFRHRADKPFHQIDVVACLIHERAAVQLPSAAPTAALVVIRLRARPKNIQMHHIDFAEALFRDRAFEQLQRGVEAVLFHHKQAFARFVGEMSQFSRHLLEL